MPVNGYTVGRDLAVSITGPSNVDITIAGNMVTHFDAKPLKREDMSRPLNSPPRCLYIPDGWRGTIEFDRQDATLDTFQSDQEANFWNGVNLLGGTLLETVTEVDGTTTQYQFNDVMF